MNKTKETDGISGKNCEYGAGRGAQAGWRGLWLSLLMVFSAVATSLGGDFVIVVDVSGSMAEGISRQDKRVRVAVVQDALRQYLPALPVGSRVDLIAFNTGIVSEQEVILKDDKDLPSALAWVDNLAGETKKNGQTHLWTTLRHALKTASRYSQENPDQPVTVRVLTDGEDNERATTLDTVLKEFLPVLDGEKIRSNMVLLGDMEFKTKLSLPEGAFETTKNPTWEVIFPPIVLCIPTVPKIGEEVRLFENTRSIYKSFEWLVDGTSVGREKVLTWQFKDPRNYRVTLKVNGLQGTQNSATVLVRVRERDKLVVDFIPSTALPEPRQVVNFISRCSGQGSTFAWFVNSDQVATTQDLIYRFDKEGQYDVKLVARDAAGSSGVKTQTIQVREQPLSVSIKGPTEIVSGRVAQFASEISGPFDSVEWRFGDGATSVDRNPQHTFECKDSEFNDLTVSFRAVSPQGTVVESAPFSVRVWAEKKVPAPKAGFRILTQTPKVGAPIQILDETTGLAESVQWDVDNAPMGSVRNPEFRISSPGEKTIRMTVRGPGGKSIFTKKVTVQPRFTQPTVWCRASKLSGISPLTVQFTNVITGDCKSLLWTFGDGQSSTNSNPQHTFGTATNFVVTLKAFPVDPTQPVTEQKLAISVAKPWPIWAKVAAVVVPALLLIGAVLALLRQRRIKALRLPVYYWAEQDVVCRTLVLTQAEESANLTPAAALRLNRSNGSRNLLLQPLEGGTLFASDGQEVPQLSVGDGVRISVRDAAGVTRTVAFSITRKPSRPTPVSHDQEAIPDPDVCGLHKSNEEGPSPTTPDEFNWGWDKASANGR